MRRVRALDAPKADGIAPRVPGLRDLGIQPQEINVMLAADAP